MKKEKKNIKIGDKVEVKWVDTFSYNGWYSSKEIADKADEGEIMMLTAGIYAGERGSFVVICGIYCPTEALSRSPFGHPNWIPKGSVKSIRKLT